MREEESYKMRNREITKREREEESYKMRNRERRRRKR